MISENFNGPFPNYLQPLPQSESLRSSFHMKMILNLHAKEISFSYERMSTKTRFEEEAKGSSEMAYLIMRVSMLIATDS